VPIAATIAGEGIRTLDVQLGKIRTVPRQNFRKFFSYLSLAIFLIGASQGSHRILSREFLCALATLRGGPHFRYDGIVEDRILNVRIVVSGDEQLSRPRSQTWGCRLGRGRLRFRMGLFVFAGYNRRCRPVDQHRRVDDRRQHGMRQQKRLGDWP
jgi:hypothetical protein